MTEAKIQREENEICIHIFSVSAGMVGVCLTVIGIFRAIGELKKFDTIGDNILAIDAHDFSRFVYDFLFCTAFDEQKFASENRKNRRRMFYDRTVADGGRLYFDCLYARLKIITNSSKKVIYAIVGPTASGKTEIGVALAERLGNAEIINCDSVQIYREIQIATAKPSAQEMRGVPHHLIGYVASEINYTAAHWAADAARKIEEIERRGNIPILVGGTGFYLRTLRQPFFESPPTDGKMRNRLNEIREKKGAEHLHKMLRKVDRATAKKLSPRDYVRSMRALEVFFQTGNRLSELQPQRVEPPEFAERIRIFVLNPPRSELYERINQRAARHYENGLVEEVKHLRANGLQDDTNALGAHGYRRVGEYLRGTRTLESAIERTKQDVRNYAKRQLSWFRGEVGVTWLEGFGDAPETQENLFRQIEIV